MNYKKYIPISIIFVCISLTFVPLFYVVERTGLEYPQCVDEPFVTTTVHFFVSQNVIEQHSMAVVQQELRYAIKKSNKILTNSCVPMQRQLGSIREVDFSKYTLSEISQVERGLRRIVGESVIQKIITQPTHYYAAVLNKNDNYFNDEFLGETDVDSNDRFFVISDDADEYTVEHELGHLAWAQHNDSSWFSTLEKRLTRGTSIENQHKLKPYARGYTCSGKGTVMSNAYDLLPIYSSPDIYYEGKACGDTKKADNAGVMREYARELRQKVFETSSRFRA